MTIKRLRTRTARLAAALLTATALAAGIGAQAANAAPSDPSIKHIIPIEETQLTVVYHDASTVERGFELAEWDKANNRLGRITALDAQDGTGDLYHAVTGLRRGTEYCFRIRSILPPVTGGISDRGIWSDFQCARTGGSVLTDRVKDTGECIVCQVPTIPDRSKPAAATNLTAERHASGSWNVLRWQDNATNEEFYLVQAVSQVSGRQVFSEEIPANSTSYIDKSDAVFMQGGVHYYVYACLRIRPPHPGANTLNCSTEAKVSFGA